MLQPNTGPNRYNQISRVMVSMIVDSSPSDKLPALRSKSKDRLARSQDNEWNWSDMSTHGLLLVC